MGIAAAELGICFIMGFMTLKYKKRNSVINMLYIIIVLATVSFILSEKTIYSSILGKTSTFTFFREFCGAVFPALGMYYLARKGQISLKLLTYFFYSIFIAAIIAFFYETITLMIDLNKQEITSNASYRFVYIMPFVVFIKGKIRIALLWVTAISLAVISVKRGAILGLTLECTLYYWWSYRASRHKMYYLLGIFLICMIGGHYLYEYYENDEYIQMRVEDTLEGKTSGRDSLITKLVHHYGEAGIVEMFKGAGFAQTLRIAGNYAHNDWMELLIDCGAVGLICYALFYGALLRSIRYSKNDFLKIQWLLFIAFFPTSFYSMVFFSEASSIGFIWLGFVLGYKDRNKYRSHSVDFHRANITEPICRRLEWN